MRTNVTRRGQLSPWRSWTDQLDRFFRDWGLGAAGNRIGDWNMWNPQTYGSFSRAIPLPEGAMTEKARATFKDGVLEITIPAPPREARRGRRIEIR